MNPQDIQEYTEKTRSGKIIKYKLNRGVRPRSIKTLSDFGWLAEMARQLDELEELAREEQIENE